MKEALIGKGHSSLPLATACLLSGVKRTSQVQAQMSAAAPEPIVKSEGSRSIRRHQLSHLIACHPLLDHNRSRDSRDALEVTGH